MSQRSAHHATFAIERDYAAAQTARVEALRAQRAAVADLYRALGG